MMQINDLLVNQTDLVVVPGEFSYGDYLRCDAIAARAPVMNAVRAFAASGGLVLGVGGS
jgi:phosphoribosylformylglycinamidine synthase